MTAHAVGIMMTEDMIEAMLSRTAAAHHAEEEEDAELLKISFIEGGHLLLTIVMGDTSLIPYLDPTLLIIIKA